MTDQPHRTAQDRPATLWQGRFSKTPDESLLAFTRSLPFDVRLWREDIDGTRAHVSMLGAVGVLEGADVQSILGALARVEEEFDTGQIVLDSTTEDVHTLLEERVTQLIGDVGAKMHTGRSRNDQVATALKLWCRRQMGLIADDMADLVEALMERAEEADRCEPPLAIASYTHLQRAQIVLLSHPLRAHAWALLRDIDRLHDALRRADVSPLGAGAVGGSTLPLDPSVSARVLGFASVFQNSIDAVSDRDFVAEFLFALATAGVHLSRLGEEIVLWSSAEFGFVVLDDAFSTGSSMLPQKKNPDIAELARGKAGRLIGNLVSVLAMLKGLPLSYNRDLQEDKEPLFDSVDTVGPACRALAGMLRSLSFVPEKLATGTSSDELHAIDLAEELVRRGVPFRRAHAEIGALVARAGREGRSLSEIVVESELFGEKYRSFFTQQESLARRRSHGGGGAESAAAQADALRGRLSAVRRARQLAE